MNIKARLTSWQASPQLRNSFVTVPGKPGVADFGSDVAERVVAVRCNVYPQFQFSNLVGVLDNLAAWLNPDNGLKQLVRDDVPDRYFTARLQDVVDCERLILAAGAFDLKFVCPDPFAYALTDESFDLTATGANTVTRTKGNTDSLPVYLLKAVIPSGAATYLTIQTNNDELKVVGALANGETLVIDSGLMTAKVVDNTGETLRNGLPLLQELNFPVLRKGANTITITAIGATGGCAFALYGTANSGEEPLEVIKRGDKINIGDTNRLYGRIPRERKHARPMAVQRSRAERRYEADGFERTRAARRYFRLERHDGFNPRRQIRSVLPAKHQQPDHRENLSKSGEQQQLFHRSWEQNCRGRLDKSHDLFRRADLQSDS